MNLKQFKQSVAEWLTDEGMKAFIHSPSAWNPPFAVIQSAPEYIVRDTYGKYTVSLEVVLIAESGTDLSEVIKVDQMIETALPALQGNVLIERVEEPDIFTDGQGQYLGAIIKINDTIDMVSDEEESG